MSGCNIKIPFQVTLDLEGTFKVQVLQADDYPLEAADETITGFLPNGILDAFVVSNASGSNVALLDVAMNLSGEAVFLAAFKEQLESALVDPTEGGSLESYLSGYANDELLKDLRNNGIAAALEADGLGELEYTNLEDSYEAGAQTMWNGLVGLPPKTRSLIATQIPNEAWLAAGNGFNNDGGMLKTSLPLKRGGDALTFQLIIEQQFNVTAEPIENYEHAGQDPVKRADPGVGAGHVDGVPYAVPRRVVNIVMRRPVPSENVAIQAASAGDMPDADSVYYIAPGESSGASVASWRLSVNESTTGWKDSNNAYQIAAKTAYDLWEEAKIRLQDKERAVTARTNATAARDAAQAVNTQAQANMAANPTPALVAAAARATDALEKAIADLSGANAAAALSNTDTSSSVDGLRSDAANKSKDAAERYNGYINAKKNLAAAEAKLENAIQLYNKTLAEKASAQESANTAAAEAKDIWDKANGVVTSIKSTLSGLSGVLDAAIALDISKNSLMGTAAAAAAAAPSDVAKADAYQAAIIAHNDAQVALEAAKVAHNAKYLDLSAAVVDANDKLKKYVKFFYYAGGDATGSTVPTTVTRAVLSSDAVIVVKSEYSDRVVAESPYALYTVEHSHA